MESRGSGNYRAVGKKTKRDTRAYGRYQIMEGNVSTWSGKVLGYPVNLEEFLSRPEYQDVIAGRIITQYINQYGPSLAARKWFSGTIYSANTTRDVNGRDVRSYVREVMSYYQAK